MGARVVGSFDVFFSYSTRDHEAVERIARDLTHRGLHVFLDRWYLVAGQPWPQVLEQTLAACNAVAVFIGADGLGPWQQRERDLALDRQARDPGFPVIPVLLTRADPALGFLRLNTWVDLTTGIADAEVLAILEAAVRREPPGPSAQQWMEAVRATICPYRGLRPFREEDELFFFGRGSFAETLTDTVARQPFVAVVGASGSGKSSVVRAGLIPRLRRGEGKLVWDALTFVPTDRPLHSLAAALLPALEADLSEVDRLAEVGKLTSHLQDGTVALRDVTARVLMKQPGTDRLLLFIDQWEELYTLCQDDAARRTFIGHLLQAAATDGVRVVLTLRGDFFGRALADRALSDQLQDAVVTIGPMTQGELAETIVKPAEAVGFGFEVGLAEAILDDVGEEPGSLPLLEFLLEALWKKRRGALLQYDAYHDLGRVSGAIAHRADEVFRGFSAAEQQAAQRLLIRMARPGDGVEDSRQPAAVPEADPVAEASIRKLADARLVVTGRDTTTGCVIVEVAHEALIRRWHRLRGWLDQDREFLRIRERIAAQARLWEAEDRPPDRLLAPGRPLEEGEDLLTTRRADLDALLIAYVDASTDAAREQAQTVPATERRRLRTTLVVAAVMLAAGLIFLEETQHGEAVINVLVGALTGLAIAIITSFMIPFVSKKQEGGEQKRESGEGKYALPLATDAAKLLWRLDEILFTQRGQYLREDAPPTPSNQYKLISTCYLIGAMLGWMRAIRLEQSYLFFGDNAAIDALRHSLLDLEAALADSPHVEMHVLSNLAQLWRIQLPSDADLLVRIAAQVAADMQYFVAEYGLTGYQELAETDDSKKLQMSRQIAGTITRMLDRPLVPEQVLTATCQKALRLIGVKTAWIYREWQQAIGDVMIRRIYRADRRFDLIGYEAFEALFRDPENPWMRRLRELVVGIDVARPDPSDFRVDQLRRVARAVAGLACAIETLDLERRILDPQTCALARKFLGTLPPAA